MLASAKLLDWALQTCHSYGVALPRSYSTGNSGERNSVSRRLPWQARKNRLASAAGKQDDSGVDRATAAHGNQDVSLAPALLARPGAKEEARSQEMKLRTNPCYGV